MLRTLMFLALVLGIGLGGRAEADAGHLIWSKVQVTSSSRPSRSAAAGNVSEKDHVLVFKKKFWRIGQADAEAPFNKGASVMVSDDGVKWEPALNGDAPWGAYQDMMSVVFKGKIWMLGGAALDPNYSSSEYPDNYRYQMSNQVWNSVDGKNWTRVTDPVPWTGRCKAACVVFDDKMWIMGGETDEGYEMWDSEFHDYPQVEYYGSDNNEVWFTSDGIHWHYDRSDVAWEARHGQSGEVRDNKIFITGGNHFVQDDNEGPYEEPVDDSVYFAVKNPHDAALAGDSTFRVERKPDVRIGVTIKNTGLVSWDGHQHYQLQESSVTSPTIPLSGKNGLMLPDNVTVAPGQTHTFTFLVNASSFFSTLVSSSTLTVGTRISVRMFQPDISFFGDPITLDIAPIQTQNIAWTKVVDSEGFDPSHMSHAVVFNGKLWLDGQYTADGVHWVQATADYSKTPWFIGNLVVFKDKLWSLGQQQYWCSDDGIHWLLKGSAPWSGSLTEESDWSVFVYQNKLWFVLNNNYGSSDYVSWCTSDGNQWFSGQNANASWQEDHYRYYDMTVYRNKVWAMAEDATLQGLESIYTSSDLKTWVDTYQFPRMDPSPITLVFHDQLWMFEGLLDFAAPGYFYWETAIYSADGKHWFPSSLLPMDIKYMPRSNAVVFGDRIWFFIPPHKIYNSSYPYDYTTYPYEIWQGTVTPDLSASPGFIDLGTQNLYSGFSTPKTLTLTNQSSATIALRGNGADLLGPQAGCFKVTGANVASPIPVGGTRALQVSFAPARLGLTTATLRISYAGPYNPALDVQLVGRGTTAHDGRYLDILGYLLGTHTNPAGLDVNGDYAVNIADLMQEGHAASAVAAPARGASWAMGTSQKITWTTTALSGGKVNLALHRNHAFYQTIASGAGNSGSYAWTVPFGVIPAGDYTIVAASASSAASLAESAAYFAIAPAAATIRVNAPAGGERWGWGSTQEIRWSAPAGVATVRLSLYKGGQYLRTLDDTPNDGHYTWYVPDDLAPGSDYQVSVSNPADRNVRNASPNCFSVLAP